MFKPPEPGQYFPLATFFLATLMVLVFLLTSTNSDYYSSLLGFVPASPQLYTLFSYLFIHANLEHIFFNLIFLVIAGYVIEQTIGKAIFLSIFFASGNIAVLFDIAGRFLTGISFSVPFVGASGAIFGLLAVAALLRPFATMPTLIALIAFIPLLQFLIFTPPPELAATGLADYFLILGIFGAFALSIAFMPFSIPIFLALIFFLINWIIIIALRFPEQVSNIGHLGGMLGGLLSFFIIASSKRKPKAKPERFRIKI